MEPWQVGIYIILAICGYILYRAFFGGQCPKCKRTHAMQRTGQYKDSGDSYEWECIHCGHRVWKEEIDWSGGGGGGGNGGG